VSIHLWISWGFAAVSIITICCGERDMALTAAILGIIAALGHLLREKKA
jgi:hypothetical protein